VLEDRPAPAVADLVAQQSADLVTDDGDDEHRGDVQLPLAGEHGGGADRGRSYERDTHIPGRGGGQDGQVSPDARAIG
jgi:hypothetical protein